MPRIQSAVLLLLNVATLISVTNAELHLSNFNFHEMKDFEDSLEELCEMDQYYDAELDKCIRCTPCADFMFVREECTSDKNTVCTWCGVTIEKEHLDPQALASFETKCTAANLEFINMARLERESRIEHSVYLGGDTEIIDGRTIEEDDEPIDDDEADYEMAQAIRDSVNGYMTLRKIKTPTFDFDPFFPHDAGFEDIVSKKTAEQTFNDFAKIPVVQDDNDESEESDETKDDVEEEEDPVKDIPSQSFDSLDWDNWVDDRVKPILRQKLDTFMTKKVELKLDNENFDNIVFSEDAVLILTPENRKGVDFEMQQTKIRTGNRKLLAVLLVILFAAVTLYVVRIIRKFPRHRTFELDPEDYKILVDSGKHAEKCNKAEEHVHDNPMYLA